MILPDESGTFTSGAHYYHFDDYNQLTHFFNVCWDEQILSIGLPFKTDDIDLTRDQAKKLMRALRAFLNCKPVTLKGKNK